MTGMTKFVGRSMEVALSEKGKMETVIVQERIVKWRVLYMSLDRTKNQNSAQPMHLFKHRTSKELCFYHQTGYHLVFQDAPSKYLYPNFAEKARVEVEEYRLKEAEEDETKGEEKGKSQVSGVFNNMIKKMSKEMEDYPDDFENANVDKITSHSLKRRGVNVLSSSPLIAPSWTFMRAGKLNAMIATDDFEAHGRMNNSL